MSADRGSPGRSPGAKVETIRRCEIEFAVDGPESSARVVLNRTRARGWAVACDHHGPVDAGQPCEHFEALASSTIGAAFLRGPHTPVPPPVQDEYGDAAIFG